MSNLISPTGVERNKRKEGREGGSRRKGCKRNLTITRILRTPPPPPPPTLATRIELIHGAKLNTRILIITGGRRPTKILVTRKPLPPSSTSPLSPHFLPAEKYFYPPPTTNELSLMNMRKWNRRFGRSDRGGSVNGIFVRAMVEWRALEWWVDHHEGSFALNLCRPEKVCGKVSSDALNRVVEGVMEIFRSIGEFARVYTKTIFFWDRWWWFDRIWGEFLLGIVRMWMFNLILGRFVCWDL